MTKQQKQLIIAEGKKVANTGKKAVKKVSPVRVPGRMSQRTLQIMPSKFGGSPYVGLADRVIRSPDASVVGKIQTRPATRLHIAPAARRAAESDIPDPFSLGLLDASAGHELFSAELKELIDDWNNADLPENDPAEPHPAGVTLTAQGLWESRRWAHSARLTTLVSFPTYCWHFGYMNIHTLQSPRFGGR